MSFTDRIEQEEELSVDQLRTILVSDNEEAREWRTDPANKVKVSELVSEFASQPGGRAARDVMRQIRKEQKQRKRQEREEAEQEARQEKLKAVAQADWLDGGGSLQEFQERWPEIRKELLASGRAQELLEEHERSRRARAARTF